MRANPPHHGLDLNADIGAYMGNEAHNPSHPQYNQGNGVFGDCEAIQMPFRHSLFVV